MTNNRILRTIDRWRFDAPLALLLAIAAAFATATMPADLFGRLPVAGGLGDAGRAGVALLLALVLGGAAYLAMRGAAAPRAAAAETVADEAEPVAHEDVPTGIPSERLMRLRRADAHPDAPPRQPIIASRDLGEPFMEVGTEAGSPEPSAQSDEASADAQAWWPEAEIPDADYVEVAEEEVVTGVAFADVRAQEPLPAPVVEEAEVAPAADAGRADRPEAASVAGSRPAAVRAGADRESIAAMMERLSAGMERRRRQPEPAVQAPVRDMRPALRDALEELNRLAERHG